MRKMNRRIQQLETGQQPTEAIESVPADSLPWWMPFRYGWLWWDADGKVCAHSEEWFEWADDINAAWLGTDSIITLLTKEEAQGALVALENGQISIKPMFFTTIHSGESREGYYIVKTAWAHPLCQPLDTALHAVNAQRCERVLMDAASVADFLRWVVAQ